MTTKPDVDVSSSRFDQLYSLYVIDKFPAAQGIYETDLVRRAAGTMYILGVLDGSSVTRHTPTPEEITAAANRFIKENGGK